MQVKSVLSAALYPNVAVMDDGGGPNARPTWHDGQGSVLVHPSSVNHPLIAVQYMRPYLIYLEKVHACHAFVPPICLGYGMEEGDNLTCRQNVHVL